MKQLKISLPAILLLVSTHAFSQIKKPPLPPPPEMNHNNLAPPPTPKIKEGHPWTRNGKDVWVAKPPKPAIPPIPPPPPPSPPKNDN